MENNMSAKMVPWVDRRDARMTEDEMAALIERTEENPRMVWNKVVIWVLLVLVWLAKIGTGFKFGVTWYIHFRKLFLQESHCPGVPAAYGKISSEPVHCGLNTLSLHDALPIWDSMAHDRAGGGRGALVGVVRAWGHMALGPCYWGSRGGTRQGGGCEVGGRWANGEGGGMVSVWVSGLGGMYLEWGHVEGGRDASHSRWTVAMVP